MARKRVRALLGLALAALVATQAHALSIVARRSHTPNLACAATKEFIAQILDGRVKDVRLAVRLNSDALGRIGYDKRQAFTKSLTENDGKPDKRAATLDALNAIHGDKFDPIYLAVIERDRWQALRYFEDAEGEGEQLPPDYEAHRSFWLVTFSSNEISSFREVDEMYPLASSGKFKDVCA